MKPKALVFPLVSLLAAAAWLVPQQRLVSAIRSQNDSLRQQLASRVAIAGTEPSSSPGAANNDPKAKAPIDWKKAAAMIQQETGGGNMREFGRLQQQLKALTAGELIAALDEIQTLDLPPALREQLEMVIAYPLSQHDPQLVLDRFIDRLNSPRSQFTWTLSSTLAAWVKKDPAAAVTWFDQQIAAGKFEDKALDGKNRSRSRFETAIMSTLIGENPTAAIARIAALPVVQRADVLGSLQFRDFKENDQQTFAMITREQLPEKDQLNTLAKPASTLASQGGYPKVTDYLDRISATPAERAEAVYRAGEGKISNLDQQRKLTRGDFDEFRDWAAVQSPDALNSATGRLLGQALQDNRAGEFTQIAEIAVSYHDSTGNDDVLGSFLDSWPARSNKEQSRILAEKISDPTRRAKILQQLK